MKERLHWIDVAKGLLMILVICGHANIHEYANVLINSFHMAGFFILSGITFNINRPFKDFLWRRTKGIIIPYFFFAMLLLAQKFVSSFITHNVFNWKSGIISIFVPISNRPTTTVYGLWFLPCIFLAELLLYGFFKFYQKQKVFAVCSFILISAFFVSTFFLMKRGSIVCILPYACLFMLLGNAFKKKTEVFKNKKFLIMPVCFVIYVASALTNRWLCGYSFDLSSFTMGIVPLYLISSVFGSGFVFCIAMCLENCKSLQRIGKDSIYYYGFHWPVLSLVQQFIHWGWLSAIITTVLLYPIVGIYVFFKKKITVRRKHD